MSGEKSKAHRSHPDRFDRFHNPCDQDDQRTRSQRDRDRVLYSSAFRRLARVTQVVSPTEIDVFHNRLTHTLKVAQVGRRLAEKLLSEQSELVNVVGGIDPEVVEAAALAHDLGHPPFGHVAESTLEECLYASGAVNGYEGNAQTFRIVTHLAFCRDQYPGLNLTRATLNAILKYPWVREAGGKKSRKFGAYHSEEKQFEFAREGVRARADAKSAEAEIMDWADDITYSVHDMEDFYQAGLIPLDQLAINKDERARFLDRTKRRWIDQERPEVEDFGDYEDAFEDLMQMVPVDRPFAGFASQRDALKPMTSVLVSRFINSLSLKDPSIGAPHTVEIERNSKVEVGILKELTWNYVILGPALATQQHGYRKIIKGLFEIYKDAIYDGKKEIIPAWFRFEDTSDTDKEEVVARTAADIVSSLTDDQALIYYKRLNGISPGSLRGWS